jgi:hypothetical protein
MGISLAWISVRGKDKDSVLRELQFAAAEERGDLSDFPLAGSDEQDGAFIISALRCDHPIVRKQTLASLSNGCTIVAGSVEEHVMYSSAALWKNGKLDWSIEHQGDVSDDNMTVIGTPEGLDEIIRGLLQDDPEADYHFDVPLLMAKKLTGFKYDETDSCMDGKFQELRAVKPVGAKPWWKLW